MKTLPLLSLLLLSGCAAMHFDLGPPPEKDNYEYAEWHHDAVFGLAELSSPVDLNARCEGRGTRSVRIDGTPMQFITKLAVGVVVYDPWRVSYDCDGKPSTASIRVGKR